MAGQVGFESLNDDKKFQVLSYLLGCPKATRGQVHDIRCVTISLPFAYLAWGSEQRLHACKGRVSPLRHIPSPHDAILDLCSKSRLLLSKKLERQIFLRQVGENRAESLKVWKDLSCRYQQFIADLKGMAALKVGRK